MRFFSTLFLLGSLVVSTFSQALITVEEDINNFNAQTAELLTFTNTFTGSTSDTPELHNGLVELWSLFHTAATDFSAVPPLSEPDGGIIFTAIRTVEPNLDQILASIVKREASIAAGGFTSTIQSDLVNLDTCIALFLNALIAHMPADLVPEVQALLERIDGTFATSISAFA